MHRRSLAWMTVAAAAVALLLGSSGAQELALYLSPFLLILGLLLSGRFVGEERIVRRRTPAAPPLVARVARPSWALVPCLSFSGLLERSPVSRRGPPAALAAVLA